MDKEKQRIKQILEKLPLIRKLIKDGYGWEVLERICEPLGLNDTAFRENPTLDDYLVSEEYWKKQLLVEDTENTKGKPNEVLTEDLTFIIEEKERIIRGKNKIIVYLIGVIFSLILYSILIMTITK
jgi:hypothetical protein